MPEKAPLRALFPATCPRTEDRAARKACLEVAAKIAGGEPPHWFVEHLERSIVRLAACRVADENRRKLKIKALLQNFRKAVASVQTKLEDPALVTLLGERQHRDDSSDIEARLEAGDYTTTKSLAEHLANSIVQEIDGLKQGLKSIVDRADFVFKLPELSGSGRSRVRFRGNVAPKRLCAFQMIVAIQYFRAMRQSGEKSFSCADLFWKGAQTALMPHVAIENDHPINSDNKLRHWRSYFKLGEKAHFAAFEVCRLEFAKAALTAGAPYPPDKQSSA